MLGAEIGLPKKCPNPPQKSEISALPIVHHHFLDTIVALENSPIWEEAVFGDLDYLK